MLDTYARDNTTPIDVESLLDDVEHLVSLPDVCIQLNAMVSNPNSSVEDIGRLINQDVALTARLLRIANSPLYGFSSQIDTVTRAVTVLGTQQIRNLVLATVAIKTFAGIPNQLVSMDSFWTHSIYCALCARYMALQRIKRQSEAVFVGALLHDIGQLVLYFRLPDLSRKVLETCIDGPHELETQEAEREIFGFDHAKIGGELARRWALPGNIQENIAWHHAPEKAPHHRVDTAIVHIANSIASLAELNSSDLSLAPAVQKIAWELTGFDESIVDSVLAHAREQFSETRSLLMGSKD